MNDRLINHTQGEAIIAQLTAINTALARIATALEAEQPAPEQEEENSGQQSGGGE